MPWLCSFFQESGNAPPDGGASAFILPAAAAAVALFWFCWYTVFSTGVFDHHHEAAHTHTPLKKKSGLPDPPTKPAKKRETTPLKTDVFLPLFSAHTRTHTRTDTQKIKGHWTQLLYKKIYIQVSNNTTFTGTLLRSATGGSQCHYSS